MSVLKIQLNHPGNQKNFAVGKGYQKVNDLIIREWNDDPRHYRKFIKNDGEYLTSLNGKPESGKLLFWGEWEGNSVFTPFKNGKGIPNGIHEPFHSTLIRGCENTDPYIYGDYFKYATCKQTGQLCDLEKYSLILFGTVYPSLNAFFIDTVFVVSVYNTPQKVSITDASDYTLTYREETLEQLEENDYLRPDPVTNKKLYHGLPWQEKRDYFSFVPCKLNEEAGFGRLKISLNDPWFDFSSNPTGISFLRGCKGSPEEAWRKIAVIAIEQGFYLGVKFTEPLRNDKILSGFIPKQPLMKSSCSGENPKFTVKKGC